MSKRRREGAATVRITPASPDDLDDLVALEAGFLAEDRFARRAWARFLKRPTAAPLIARDDLGAALGAAVVLFHACRAHGRLYSIVVDERARGRGVGAALLADAESLTLSRGADALRLEVRASNAVARALYEAAGYRNLGTSPAYYPDGEDAVRYEKRLSATAR